VDQPKIDLKKPDNLELKIIEVKRMRQENLVKRTQRISPAQMNFLQQQETTRTARNETQTKPVNFE
jgi:hypothetical protein